MLVIKKTDNYAIPVMTSLMSLLRNMNFDFNKKGYCIVSFEKLRSFVDIIIHSEDNRNSFIIDKLLNHLKVTLVGEYDANIELLVNDINNIKGLLNGYYDCGSNVHRILEYVLKHSEMSIENIKMLCIQDKFISAVKENKEKQKVKSI